MWTVLQDVKHSIRRLAKTPGFTALAVITLTIGIGAHLAIVGLIDRQFLQRLPVTDPEGLIGIYESRDGSGHYPLSLLDYRDYRAAVTTFGRLAASYPSAPLSLGTDEGQTQVNGSVVSANYFAVLGVSPARGRFFSSTEDAAGAPAVAVVSHAFWQSRLGGRDDVVGATVSLNDQTFTVVGVAPSTFTGIDLSLPATVWLPMASASVGYRWCDTEDRDCTWLSLIGRLAPGQSIDTASAEMEALSQGVREASGSDPATRGVALTPLRGIHPDNRANRLRLSALMLAAVTLVLLIAAANLSGMLVARGLTRRREIAVRAALGAPRWRVMSLFASEAMLLALGGAVGGLVMAGGLGDLLARLDRNRVPLDVRPGLAMVGYALFVAAAIGVLVASIPAIQSMRPRLVAALGRDGEGTGMRRPSMLSALVIVQVAASFVLVSCTGLLARSLVEVRQPGSVDPAHLAVLRARQRLVGTSPERARANNHAILDRLASLPGVEGVTLSKYPPLLGGGGTVMVTPGVAASGLAASGLAASGAAAGAGDAVDVPPAKLGAGRSARINQVGARFFATLGVRLLRGREFEASDGPQRTPVAIVNQKLAGDLWPNQDPLGARITIEGRHAMVVGVIQDGDYHDHSRTAEAQVFTPYWQNPSLVDARFTIRTRSAAADLLPALRREVRAIDPAIPVWRAETMTDIRRRLFASTHLAGRVMGAAGGVALFSSGLGLLGALALVVARRTREIGIRMALGCDRGRVVRLVLGDTARLVGLALGIGMVAALAAGRALAHDLYGVGPYDPWALAIALLVVIGAAGLASWLPARRAATVDPLVALRQD